MNFVEPLRDRKKIDEIKTTLRQQQRYRDLLLFVFGINSALRACDLIGLQINDILDERKKIKIQFWIREKKRNKRIEVIINKSMKKALEEYFHNYPKIREDRKNYLFFNTKTMSYKEAICRGQVWKIINKVCREVHLSGSFGSHTMRKTWGYHARMMGVDLALIMHKLNHNSLAYTKRYLGVTNDELAEISRKVNL